MDISLNVFLNCFALVFLGEMGDKTQLLALILAARFRAPWTILFGVLIATILNHALAAWGGNYVAVLVDEKTLAWILAGTFIAFAAWILIPDKEDGLSSESRFGPLLTTIVAFFLAEMGDKTQLATVALGARYPQVMLVTLGTTFGMLASNALAIFLGDRLLRRIPMAWIRRGASLMFFIFGLAIAYQAY